MQMMAVMPLRMIELLIVSSGEARNRIMVRPETAIITIMMAIPIST